MSNFWAKHLGEPAPQQQYNPTYRQPQPTYQPPPPVAAPPVPAPARLTRSGICPECNSGNFMSGVSGVRERCYDCGYPVTQSSSSINTLVRPGGNVVETNFEATRQLNTKSNYHPDQIVDRLQ